MADTFDTQGFATEARSHGYSWDEINSTLDGFREHALKNGYSGDEIDNFLGYQTNSDIEQRLRAHAESNLSAEAQQVATLRDKPEVSGKLDAFINGLQLSAPGLMTRGQLPEKEMPQDPDLMTRIAHAAGMAIGDLPVNVIGAIGGAAAGTATAGPGVGTTLGGGAGMMALPEYIRSSYIDALQNGKIKDPRDFAIRMGSVLWNTTKQAIVGGLTAGTGKVVGAGLDIVGAGAVEHAAVTTMAELGVMTTAAAGLEGRLPKPEEFIDGAVLLAGFKGATSIASAGRSAALNTIRENLQRHWAKTGEPTMETIARAMEDPAFRNIIVSDMPPEAHPGSSKTPTDIFGDYVVDKPAEVPAPTGRELPAGVRFEAEANIRDENDKPIEHTARLTGPDGDPLYEGQITQLDEKMWDIDKIEQKGDIEGIGVRQHDWTRIEDDKLQKLAEEGFGSRQIADQMGFTRRQVRTRMDQLDIKRADFGRGGTPGTISYQIMNMLRDGKSNAEIAQELGITKEYVSTFISALGIKGGQKGKARRTLQNAPDWFKEEMAQDLESEGLEGITGHQPDLDVAFIAHMADYAQSRGGRLMTGMQDGGLPTEILDKLDRAGLLEEVKTGRGMIYQILGTKAPPDGGVRDVEGNSPSLGMPHSEAAQTGDANVDAVLNRPKVKEAIDNPQIDRTKDIPDWAGASGPADDLSTHVDRHIPRSVMLNGVTFDPAVPLNIHEQVERSKMEELIPQFVKAAMEGRTGETPITPEERAKIRTDAEKKAYKIAHEDYATKAEHSWLRSHNIPVDQYEALFQEWGKSINSYDPENLPDDLYMVNKHGPTDLGPEAIVAPGQPTGAAGTSSVIRPTPSPRNAFALATPWTGTVDEARDAILGRMADVRKGPGIWDRIKQKAYNVFLEMIEPEHPVNIANDAIQRGGRLTDATNAKFGHRLAELAPNQAMYVVRENMIDFGGRITGPGLNTILGFTNRNRENFDRFWGYAIARWAVEKAQQNKETGVNLSAAHAVLDFEHAGGIHTPPTDPMSVAAGMGVQVFARLPGTHQQTDLYGPHYQGGPSPVVNMWQPGTGKNLHEAATKGLDYENHFGKGMTFDVILAHELGHAVAYNYGWGKGDVRDPGDREMLRQELTINSRRYKPAFWSPDTPLGKLQQKHIRKSSELMADAMATWMTEPGARARMPVFQRLMDSRMGIPVDWRTTLGEVPLQLGTETSRAFEDLIDWQNGTLQWLRDSGILNGEQYLKLVAENQSRIPGYREPQVQAREEKIRGPGPGFTSYDPIKAFFGSGSKIEDIQKSLLADAFLRMQLATRNRLNRVLADNLQPLNLAGKVRDPALKLNLTMDELRQIIDITKTKSGMPNAVMTAPDNYGIWRVIKRETKPDEIPVFRDGKLEKWKFEDPDLTRYLKGFNEQQMSEFSKITSRFAKMLRFGVVMNPLFPVRLAGYDIPWQFITKPEVRNTFFGFVEGLAHSVLYRVPGVGATDTYAGWLRSGGAERVFDGLTKSQFIADNLANKPTDKTFLNGVANVIASPYHALRAWAQILSEAQRVGRYAQGIREGETPLRAGMASSESAFHRAGFGGPALRAINQNIPFTAAYVNSLNQTVRSQFGIGETITGQKYNWLKFTAKATAIVTMPMLMQFYAYKDTEWYKAQPDWQKDNGLFFPIGGTPDKPDHILFYKYPPVISFLYGGLPRRLLAAYQSDNPGVELSKGWSGMLGSLLPGGLQYTILQPLLEAWGNKSWFTGQPIMSPDVIKNFTGQPQQQFNQYSTETAKAMSKLLHDTPVLNNVHITPWQIDHMIQGLAGTAGDALVRYAEMGLQKAGVLPDVGKPSMHWPEDYPLFRSWMGRYPSASAQPIKDFYDRMAERQGVHDSLVKDMTLGNFDDFKKTLDANPTDGAYHSFRMRAQNGALSQINNGTFDDQAMATKNNLGGLSRYIAALQDAQAKGDRGAAEAAIIAEKALKNLRTTAIVLERSKPGPGVPSADDKRQLLDRLYSEMQTDAEAALKVMNKARM